MHIPRKILQLSYRMKEKSLKLTNVFLTDTMCMSLPDIILVFLFLYMYTILQRQSRQFWVSFLIIHFDQGC